MMFSKVKLAFPPDVIAVAVVVDAAVDVVVGC